jgi:hypothetical protein
METQLFIHVNGTGIARMASSHTINVCVCVCVCVNVCTMVNGTGIARMASPHFSVCVCV